MAAERSAHPLAAQNRPQEKKMTGRARLRCQARELAGGQCDWPTCQRPGVELAHLHSIGAGGRRSADTIANVAWLCSPHGLMSDGKQRSWPEFKQAHTVLFGDGWEDRIPMAQWAWHRAEALAEHVARKRGSVEHKEE